MTRALATDEGPPIVAGAAPVTRPTLRRPPDPRPAPMVWADGELPQRDQHTLWAGLSIDGDRKGSAGTAMQRPATPLLVGPMWAGPRRPDLPDPAGWSVALARAVAEVLAGRRPVSQLTRWADDCVLAELSLLARRRGGPGPRPALAAVRLQLPTPTTVEVAACLRVGDRTEAMALRLEAWHDRWLCTAVQVAPRPL